MALGLGAFARASAPDPLMDGAPRRPGDLTSDPPPAYSGEGSDPASRTKELTKRAKQVGKNSHAPAADSDIEDPSVDPNSQEKEGWFSNSMKSFGESMKTFLNWDKRSAAAFAWGMGIGTGIGVFYGIALGAPGFGLAFGIFAGLVIGLLLNQTK